MGGKSSCIYRFVFVPLITLVVDIQYCCYTFVGVICAACSYVGRPPLLLPRNSYIKLCLMFQIAVNFILFALPCFGSVERWSTCSRKGNACVRLNINGKCIIGLKLFCFTLFSNFLTKFSKQKPKIQNRWKEYMYTHTHICVCMFIKKYIFIWFSNNMCVGVLLVHVFLLFFNFYYYLFIVWVSYIFYDFYKGK